MYILYMVVMDDIHALYIQKYTEVIPVIIISSVTVRESKVN